MDHSINYTTTRDALMKAGERLKPLLSGSDGDITRVQEALQRLSDNRFEVAVIGQVKAGKSTFLNALIMRPNLLPTDVNPWTAVIGRMHFGRLDGKHPHGVFRFFTPEEWQEMTDAGGVRERILEKMPPWLGKASHEDKKKQNLDAQRKRIAAQAQRKLGSELKWILGQHHECHDLTRANLEKYLASGEVPEGIEKDNPEAGKYADVTREAELFLDLEPFNEPCTIVDTPGTNDPFLVRDEITRGYLAHTDAYILVLQASQALNATIVETIKELIHGLYKEKLVIFINRIDGLADIERNLPRVVQLVRNYFASEYPSLKVPIIAGSAWWAEQACIAAETGPSEDFKDLLGMPLKLARNKRLITDDRVRAWKHEPAAHIGELAKTLRAVSGFDDVLEAIDSTLLRNKGLSVLRTASGGLRAIADASADTLEMKIRTKQEDAERIHNDLEQKTQETQKQVERLGKKIVSLQDDQAKIENALEGAKEELEEMNEDELGGLTFHISSIVNDFAKQEGAKLRNKGIHAFDERELNVDVEDLRTDLERGFLDKYKNIARSVHRRQKVQIEKLQSILDGVRNGAGHELECAAPEEVDPSPSLADVSRTVALDQGGFLERLFSSQANVDVHAGKLEKDIREEFREVVDGLMVSARGAVRGAVGHSYDRLVTVTESALERIRTDLEESRKRLEDVSRMKDDQKRSEVERLKGEAAEAKSQVSKLRDFAQEVATLQLPRA